MHWKYPAVLFTTIFYETKKKAHWSLNDGKRTVTETGTVVTPQEFMHMKSKVEKLEGIIQVLKMVDCTVSSPLQDKLKALEALYSQFSVHTLCDKWEKGKNRNLLQQQFHAERLNEIWVSDITVFKFRDTYYICAIIDLFSRRVIAHRISKHNSTQLVTKTFKQAYCERKPKAVLMFHSDRGTQYMSYAFAQLLKDSGVKQSFSRTGRPHDNAVAEAFFSILKREELYRRHYTSEADLLRGIHGYMDFYNKERPHSTIQYKTPEQKEQEYWNKNKELPIK